MTNQVIPEAAVEAAVAAVSRNYGSSGTPTNTVLWNRMVADVHAALSAALPHIQAQTLDEAVDAFPLETITAPDNAVVWMHRRAQDIRGRI